MIRILSLLISLISLMALGQAPQGVSYQAVALDINGSELINQSISIRASVLSGSSTGNMEWQETHSVTTDDFGLFTLIIGEGVSTTNGSQTNFSSILWGSNTHFLKIEMDVSGGSSYSLMGVNQMMSVPYALYAESANINYDSIFNLLSSDSTFIINVSNGIGGGCDYKFPDGIEGEFITRQLCDNSSNPTPYQVPAGKTLYITSAQSDHIIYLEDDFGVNAPIVSEVNNSAGLYGSHTLHNPIIVGEGKTVSGCNSDYTVINGILIENSLVTPITRNGPTSPPFSVPSGKKLIITNSYGGHLNVDGMRIDEEAGQNYTLGSPILVNSGQSIGSQSFNGYLVDANFFVNCSTSNSISTSSINYDSLVTLLNNDSTFLANFSGGGAVSNFIAFDTAIAIRDGQGPASSNGSVFQTVDLSPFIPTTAKMIYIMCGTRDNGGGSWPDIYIRDKHYARNPTTGVTYPWETNPYPGGGGGQLFHGRHEHLGLIPVDTSLTFEYRVANGTNPSGNAFIYILGYVDEVSNNSGGSGSSSSSPSVGISSDPEYPDGLTNIQPIMITMNSIGSEYIVPSGKNLYITNYNPIHINSYLKIEPNNSIPGNVYDGWIQYGESSVDQGENFPRPLIVGENKWVRKQSSSSADATLIGFLVDATVEPITWNLINSNYQVPAGKILCITNWSSNLNTSQLSVDGIDICVGLSNWCGASNNCGNGAPQLESALDQIFFIDEMKTVTGTGGQNIFNGYLINK